MKTLYLLRHAKSSWANPGTGDHDRPLNNRGRKAAPDMGRHMKNSGMVPGKIWCSTALRARETLDLWCLGADVEPDISHTRDLYMASPAAILAVARATEEENDSCMIVAHNPGMQQAAILLSGDTAPSEIFSGYPTAALTAIEFDVDHWVDVGVMPGRITAFVTPRNLANL